MIAPTFAALSLLIAAAVEGAPAAPLQTPADCLRWSLDWTGRIARGEPESKVVPPAFREHGLAPLREEAVAEFARGLERRREEVERNFGPVLDPQPESPGALQFTPSFLHVFTVVRHASGRDHWRFAWVLEGGVWKLSSMERGAADPNRGLLARRVDPEGRVRNPLPSVAWKQDDSRVGGDFPDDVRTAADARKAAHGVVDRLTRDDLEGAVEGLYGGWNVRPRSDAELRNEVAALGRTARAQDPLGALRPGGAEFLGSVDSTPRFKVFLYALRREWGLRFAACECVERGGVWRLRALDLGPAAFPLAVRLALRRPGSPPQETAPQSAEPGPRAGMSADLRADEAACRREAAAAMEDLAAGREEKLAALLARSASPGRPAPRTAALRRLDAAAASAQGLGDAIGATARIGRVRLGNDYFEEAFSLERAQGGGPWSFRFQRAAEGWRPAGVSAAGGIGAVRIALLHPHPVWAPREPVAASHVAALYAPRWKPFDPAAPPRDSLAEPSDCFQEASRLAAEVARGELAPALRAFLRRWGAPAFRDPQQQERLVAAAERIFADAANESGPLQGGVECLGRLEEGPSYATYCFLLKREPDVQPIALGFYRGKQGWICTQLHLGPGAKDEVLKLADVEFE